MRKIAIMTDSNSGITQKEGMELGITVLPMPFTIGNNDFYEDINLTQDEFYKKLVDNEEVVTSQPIVGDILDTWNRLLLEYDEIVHLPMSSGLSGSCATASMLAEDFDGRVQVVNNQRISVTLRQSVLDAIHLAKIGKSAKEIKDILEETKFDSSIYIMVDTLKYLKKGGRITPAAAAIGTILNLKPVLQIQGEKLDAFAKARNVKQAKRIMTEQMKKDMETRFAQFMEDKTMRVFVAYTYDREPAEEFVKELQSIFPEHEIEVHPLSLSVACHIGPGSIAIACANSLEKMNEIG